jgi:putative oxidoreductase
MSARVVFEAASTPRLELAALTLLRVAYALVILTHGVPKLLHLPHGTMGEPFASTTRLIAATVGPMFAAPLAWAVTLLETAGAAMLAAGLVTRFVSLMFALEMVGISIAMGPAWAWIDHGIEYPVMLGLVAVYLAARGGGRWSADAWRRG